MTIAEAEERCEELYDQLFDIDQEYDFGGWAKHCGQIKMNPLHEELSKLTMAIYRAKETIEIEI